MILIHSFLCRPKLTSQRILSMLMETAFPRSFLRSYILLLTSQKGQLLYSIPLSCSIKAFLKYIWRQQSIWATYLNVISNVLQVYLFLWWTKVHYLLIWWLFEGLGMFFFFIVMVLPNICEIFHLLCFIARTYNFPFSINICRTRFNQEYQNRACLLWVVLMLLQVVW